MASPTNSANSETDKMEKFDARLSQFDDRFNKIEDALQKILTAKPETITQEKRGSKRSASQIQIDSFEEESDEEMKTPKKRKPAPKKTKIDDKDNIDSSDGEIKDDDDVLEVEDISDDELLKEIDNDLDNKEKTSDKVAESMADIINKRFGQGLPENKLKERLDKYARPENCQSLQVPKVNKEIWKDLPVAAKQADVRLAGVQRAIIKATSALAQSTQEILKAYKHKKLTDKDVKDKITDQNADAMALLGHACHDLSVKRRYAIRPHLSKQLTGLCGENVPITSQLFGDNLSGTIKELKELDKLSREAGQRYNYKHHNKPWQRHNKDRRPFLGQKQHFGQSGVNFHYHKKAGKPSNSKQTYQRK